VKPLGRGELIYDKSEIEVKPYHKDSIENGKAYLQHPVLVEKDRKKRQGRSGSAYDEQTPRGIVEFTVEIHSHRLEDYPVGVVKKYG
jgi:hypothetical protein